jgi:hypothetical protein
VANYFDINRGDRFERLVSMSSRERSLSAYREANVPKSSPKQTETYRCGDMNTSLIKTAKGRTVMLQHDVTTPRPYSRLNHVSGTKGASATIRPGSFRTGRGRRSGEPSRRGRRSSSIGSGRSSASSPKEGGHGGMDYVMSWRLLQCVREGLVPDMDVYDAAAWSAPSPLSEQSVASGSAPVDFPDFTRGRWSEPGGGSRSPEREISGWPVLHGLAGSLAGRQSARLVTSIDPHERRKAAALSSGGLLRLPN